MLPSPFSKGINAIKNLFGNQNRQVTVIGGKPLTSSIPNYPYAGYQVKSGDTFDNIAANNGLTTAQVQQANNNMLVPPPAGRYINLPAEPNQFLNFNRPATQPTQAAPFMTYQQAQQAGRVPQQPGQNAPTGYGPYWQQNQPGVITPTQNTTPTGQAGIAQWQSEAHNVTTQFSSQAFPPSISAGAVQYIRNPETGRPLTSQELGLMGYTFNPATASYVFSGEGGGGGQGGGLLGGNTAGSLPDTDFTRTGFMQKYIQQGTPFVQQKRWDPKRKKYVPIGQLLNEGKLGLQGQWRWGNKIPGLGGRGGGRGGGGWQNRGGGGGGEEAPPEPPAGYSSTSTPGRQLNTNRRGG